MTGPSGSSGSVGDGPRGHGPRGMWWVAWRQHRRQVAVVLALIAAVIVAEIAFREVLLAQFAALGCHPTSAAQCGEIVWYGRDHLGVLSSLLHVIVIIAPVVLGVFAAAPIFAHEFSHRTHVFALTQSVGRLHWWTAKVIVAGVPLIAGLVALGFVTGWVDGASTFSAHHGLVVGNFFVRAIIPAADGLLAFAVGVAAGVVTRSNVPALVCGLIASGLIVAGMALTQPHVLPPTRQVTAIAAQIRLSADPSPLAGDPHAVLLSSGYLDARGDTVPARYYYDCLSSANQAADTAAGVSSSGISVGGGSSGGAASAPPEPQGSPRYHDALYRATLDCAHRRGIVAYYTVYLPGSLLWPLRWALTGIAAVIAALFLLLGAWRLRPAVSRR